MEIRNSKKLMSVQKVYIVILLICLTFSLIHGRYHYGKNTEAALCSAQCEALCIDRVRNCEPMCQGNRTWVTDCDGPNCPGTCSVLWTRYNYQINNLVPTRTPHIENADDTSFELTWDRPPLTPLTTIFMIEKKTVEEHNTSSVKMIGWIRGTRYKVDRTGACDNSSYRVMAVNQFGAMGFSNYIKVPGVIPGLLQNMKYSGQGVYYYKNMSLFMAILEWSLNPGWNDTDIAKYDINPIVKTRCKNMNHISIPTFREMVPNARTDIYKGSFFPQTNRDWNALPDSLVSYAEDADDSVARFTSLQNKRRLLMTIAAGSIGCVFTPEIRAVSRCGVYGPWTSFTVYLTNCSMITGYRCKPEIFDPPGVAQNVSLAVSPMMPPSPFAVDLHILWEPPTDLGSAGVIDKYMIRSGKAEQLISPLPASFIETPMVRNVSQDIREMIFQLQTEPVPFMYGVQVIPYAPGQHMSENEMGMIKMETIHVGHNDSIAPFRKQGTVLHDSNGIVIVYMNKTMPIQFMFDTAQGKSKNSSIDRLAVQWGPMVGPNQLYIENRTVIPMNQSELRVLLKSSNKEYGLKMKYLSFDDEPDDTDWETIPLVPFERPDISEKDNNTDEIKEDNNTDEVKEEKLNPSAGQFSLVPVYVMVPVITLIVAAIFFVRFGIRRQHFKNLEERLAEIEEEADENGEIDHYYVMRAQEEGCENLSPTVVPDAWELPHTCLKIGRTLGSGAFGQVVKGRISRSLMMHRGIKLPGTEGKSGLFVTVAVKMLQEYMEDRYRQDFLNEIKMMKDIGYHRNIVSILGCCTLREPYCLIVEHVPYGDLLTYLRKIRHRIQEREEEIGNYVNQEVDLFSPLDLLSVARQITLGMEYLSQKGFVHRDLAARNVLVGKNKTVKIGDFGLAKYIYHDIGKVYVNRRGGKLPLKWMSVEAIFDLTFSTASDVWAFGVVLFEIVTLGGSPYPLVSNADLLSELRNGYRMERPENCSKEIYEIMLWCWKTKPSDRPSFTQLQETFTAMLQRDSGQDYFSFDINETREYYKINSDEMDQNETAAESKTKTKDDETDTIAVVEKEHHLQMELPDITKHSPRQLKICLESVNSKTEDNGKCYTETEAFLNNNNLTSSALNVSLAATTSRSIPGNDCVSEVNEDTISDCSENSCLAGIRRTVSELDRLSGSSDEVFTECPGCLKLSNYEKSISVCPDCLKTTINLTMFDLHGTDRNDSAISSATSDELKSDDGRSPNVSISSSENSILPITDTKIVQSKGWLNKINVEKTFSTRYYDEAVLAEMKKRHPEWTEHDSIPLEKSRTYETVFDQDPVIGSQNVLSSASHAFSSSDPYCNYHIDVGEGEIWNVAMTKM